MNKLDNYYNKEWRNRMLDKLNKYLVVTLTLLMANVVITNKTLGFYKSKYNTIITIVIVNTTNIVIICVTEV